MITKEWVVDRSGWEPGPWDDEPDHAAWRHDGVPCVLVRNRMGAWCGYVGVPSGHPWHGKGYDEVHDLSPDLDIHGGLTYSEPCNGHVCHAPGPDEDDDFWWLGFDTAHAGDLTPSSTAYRSRPGWPRMPEGYETYRDEAYTRAETERLAEFAIAAKAPLPSS